MGPTHMPLHHLLPLKCFSNAQHAYALLLVGSAWMSPPAGASAAVSSVRRAKTLNQTIGWPALSFSLPNGPGILSSVDYIGPQPLTPQGNAYTLLFTDRFCRRADMYGHYRS